MIYDIIIIGNGILAYSSAYRLLKKDPTVKIAIIGPQNPRGSATFAAGAMLNSYAELTNTTLLSSAGSVKFEMARKASQLWPGWVKEINEDLKDDQQIEIKLGTYVINNSLSGRLECENYEVILTALKGYGEDFEEIGSQHIPGLSALEGCRPIRSLYIPNEGHIDSHKVMKSLETILKRNLNVTIINDYVLRINYEQDKVTGVGTKENRTLFSQQVLLAAGAFSQKLIDTIPEIQPRIPPVFAGVGVSLLLKQNLEEPIQHVIRTPNRSGACGLHVLPRNEENLYVGASNNVYIHPSTQVTAGISHFLLQCAIEQINQRFYQNEILEWSVGNRPACLDTFPLLGPTSVQGLWILTGTYRDGFHQSPLLADEFSNMMLGKPNQLDKAFLPERRPIQTRTVQQSIDEYIVHYLAASYEHGAHPPRFLQEKGYTVAARNKVERWYDLLQTDYGLAPDMVFMFDFAPDQDVLVKYLKNYLKN